MEEEVLFRKMQFVAVKSSSLRGFWEEGRVSSNILPAFPMFKKKATHMGACLALHVVVAVLLFVASIAALLGVYKAHMLSSGFVFGTTSGSLALLAFAVSLSLCMYQLKCCVTKCEACMVK